MVRHAFVTLAILCSTLSPVAAQSGEEMFPMGAGTYWKYRGEVAWQVAGDKVRRAKVEWKMEVMDSVQRGEFRAALLLGHPKDLDWYEEGRERGCYILLAVRNQQFYMSECGAKESRERLDLSQDFSQLVKQEDLVLSLPLHEGDIFGQASARPRSDGMYAWKVTSVEQISLKSILGISPAKSRAGYVLTYQTNPDHEIDTYVPGIGLTGYIYRHHGTVSDVDMKLIEFHAPAK